MEWKSQRVLRSWLMLNKLTSLFFMLSISALLFTILTSTCTSDCRFPSSTAEADTNVQKEQREEISVMRMPLSLVRRYLSGPGSSPPRCNAKCGRCMPCKPVHVPVPPRTPVTAEYYPEAWRCKCGNKLYMP